MHFILNVKCFRENYILKRNTLNINIIILPLGISSTFMNFFEDSHYNLFKLSSLYIINHLNYSIKTYLKIF